MIVIMTWKYSAGKRRLTYNSHRYSKSIKFSFTFGIWYKLILFHGETHFPKAHLILHKYDFFVCNIQYIHSENPHLHQILPLNFPDMNRMSLYQFPENMTVLKKVNQDDDF